MKGRFSRLALAAGCVAAAAAQPRLNLGRNTPGELTLTWDDSARLERADRVEGPWELVPQAASGWKTALGAGRQYFRLRVQYPVQVMRTGTGAGRVVSSPTGLDCGNTCVAWLDPGAIVTLTAQPEAGSQFAGWSGAATGTQPAQVTVTGPLSLTARFEPLAPPTGLVNADFEAGPGVGWIEWPGTLIMPAASLGISAASGQYVARLGWGSDNRRSEVLAQEVTLPAATPLYLYVAYWIYSEELCDVGYYDRFRVYVNDDIVSENDRLCRSDNTGGWEWARLNLSAYAGRRVLLAFEIFSHSADPLASIVVLDALQLQNSL